MDDLGWRTRVVVAVLCGVFWCSASAGAAPALADGQPSGGDVQVAQTLGDRELTVVIRRAAPVPGPLRVEIVTHAGSPPGTLTLRTSPTGADTGDSLPPSGTVLSEAPISLGAQPGSYSATLRVDRPGPWELSLIDTATVARIPFVVAAPVTTPTERATYGGFVAAGALLLIALVVAVRSKRALPALVPAAGFVAAVAVGVTGALLSASTPPPSEPGRLLDPTSGNIDDPYPGNQLSTVDYSRPPVNLLLTAPGASAGAPVDLRLSLADGATGRPVDDLLVRDNASLHLVVLDPAGGMRHLHPIRVGPGDYRVRLVPPVAGEYAVGAELARRGGGTQLLRSSFTVTPGPDERTVHTNTARVETGIKEAGLASTVAVRFGGAADLQPWLGMLGHLVVVGPLPDGAPAARAPVWAHVHAMLPAVSGVANGMPDETVAAYGPDVRFVYTFPQPGRYRLWAQAERGYSVLTVPVTVDVPATGGTGR